MTIAFVTIILFSYIVNSADHSLNNTSFKGSISCGEIRSETILNKPDLYSFNVLQTQDITLSLCDSPYSLSFRSRIDFYDDQYQLITLCTGTTKPIQHYVLAHTCNVCSIGSDRKASITLNALSPGKYYIQIVNMISYSIDNKTFFYPVYTLEMSCTQSATTTTFAPKTTRRISNDNVSGNSGISTFTIMIIFFVAVSVVVIIFFVAVCLANILNHHIYLINFIPPYWNKHTLTNSDEFDDESDIDTLPSQNIPIPSAPIIDENVSLMINVSNDDRPEGFVGNIDTEAVFDINKEGDNVCGVYGDIESFFYNKVNIDGYNDIYIGLFIENGFGNLDVLKNLSDDDLKAIGVDKLDHRQKIMNEIWKIIDLVYGKN